MNHLGDTNKMVSETPISDSTPHNVADLGMQIRRLERLAAVRLAYTQQLEAQVERLTAKVAQLYEGAEEQTQRIKRLEEALDKTTKIASKHIKQLEDAGDAVAAIIGPPGSAHWADENQVDGAWNNWTKAKEAKP
jgi:TolA-binding protein